LDEIEQMQENEARKRELIITQLYAKLNNEIRRKVTNAEGSLQVIQRKRTKAGTK
jgi:HD superfamily phosphohydrolase YqeK